MVKKVGVQKLFWELIDEMFKRVGAEPSEKFFENPYWWNAYSWTTDEQEDFKRWAMEHMGKNRIFKGMSLNRHMKEIEWFLLMYGWKVTGEDGSEGEVQEKAH